MFQRLVRYSWFRLACVLPLVCGFLIVSCFADNTVAGQYQTTGTFTSSDNSKSVSYTFSVTSSGVKDILNAGSYNISVTESQYNSVETGTLTETVNEGSTGESFQMATPSFTVAPLTGTVSNASSLTVSPKGTSDRVLHFNSNGYTVYGTNTTSGTRTSVNAAHNSTGSLSSSRTLYVHQLHYMFYFSPTAEDMVLNNGWLNLVLGFSNNVIGYAGFYNLKSSYDCFSTNYRLWNSPSYGGNTVSLYYSLPEGLENVRRSHYNRIILPTGRTIAVQFDVDVLSDSEAFNNLIDTNVLKVPTMAISSATAPGTIIDSAAGLTEKQTQQQAAQYSEFTSNGSNAAINTVVSGSNGLSSFGDSIESISASISQVWQTDFSASPELVFPSYSLPISSGSGVTYYELWPNMTFNFDWIQNNWGFSALKTALNFATVYAVYRGLLSYLIAVYDAIMQGHFKNDLY